MHRADSPNEDSSSIRSVTACASNNFTDKAPQKSSMVVPVWVSHVSNPNKEQLIYTMLDSQSDSCFITVNTAEALGLEGKETRLSLSTMTANDKLIKCNRFEGLKVRSFDGQCGISLPSVYSRNKIPFNRDHIPSKVMTADWPYLDPLKHKLVPKMNCEVGMLIGYDCPRALVPREVITSKDSSDGPFGLKTDLGWGIVGVVGQSTGPNTNALGQYSNSTQTGASVTQRRRQGGLHASRHRQPPA